MSDQRKWEENYRWYVCEQKSGNSWNCVQTSLKEAIEYRIMNEMGDRLTTVIPIFRYQPRLFDRLVLRLALVPRVGIIQ